MRYQQDLQVALRERLRRLMSATHYTYGTEVDQLVTWLEGQQPLQAILTHTSGEVREVVSILEWLELCRQQRGPYWPPGISEAARAALIWDFLRHISADTTGSMTSYAHVFSHESNHNDALRDMTDSSVAPLFDYLTEQVGTDSTALYILERAKARLEWFDRDELHQRYQADTTHGEDLYDRYLRRFMFDQGMNMPMSQGRSASGLADITSDIDSDQAVLVEVKLFDGASHGKRVLATGFTQCVQYAKDYRQHTSYLLIVNLSGRVLELPTDGAIGQWPPCVTISGIRVYLVDVRALPTATASKQGKLNPVVVTHEDLTTRVP